MAWGEGNTIIYAEDWVMALQAELDEPNKFMEICNVVFSNTRLLHNPYLTDMTVQAITRGSPYSNQVVIQTDDTVTISDGAIAPQLIDRADLAQSRYLDQMEMAKRQGILLKEDIETSLYADHAACTDFGAGDITGGTVGDTTQITVSATNIDDIIRHIKRVIRVANGASLMERNGVFIVWRPGDFELLEAFMQANGFNSADKALQDGVAGGVKYMGVTHYTSNLLATNHLLAGVKKVYYLGILKATFGQIMVNDKDPGQVSGISIVSRVDFRENVWVKTKPVLFDVNVA